MIYSKWNQVQSGLTGALKQPGDVALCMQMLLTPNDMHGDFGMSCGAHWIFSHEATVNTVTAVITWGWREYLN